MKELEPIDISKELEGREDLSTEDKLSILITVTIARLNQVIEHLNKPIGFVFKSVEDIENEGEVFDSNSFPDWSEERE